MCTSFGIMNIPVVIYNCKCSRVALAVFNSLGHFILTNKGLDLSVITETDLPI